MSDAALRAEVASLRAQLAFLEARSPGIGIVTCESVRDLRCWNSLAHRAWEALPTAVRFAFAGGGSTAVVLQGMSRWTDIEKEKISVPAPAKRRNAMQGVGVSQVGGGQPMHELLRFEDGGRPVWNETLLQTGMDLLARAKTLSPVDYPHAAEDVILACRTIAADIPHASRRGGASQQQQARVAVFSSISPWIELSLLASCAPNASGVTQWHSLTTIDYNPPILEAGAVASGVPLRSATPAALRSTPSGGAARFGLVVSFSGIEHDGLGRYGDPVNPEGDFAAMREIWLSLAPRGLLLLGVPTCHRDVIYFPWHRVYGPARLRRLIRGFALRARVWAETIIWGDLDTSSARTPLLYPRGACWWQHQQVLVLQRLDEWPEGERNGTSR